MTSLVSHRQKVISKVKAWPDFVSKVVIERVLSTRTHKTTAGALAQTAITGGWLQRNSQHWTSQRCRRLIGTSASRGAHRSHRSGRTRGTLECIPSLSFQRPTRENASKYGVAGDFLSDTSALVQDWKVDKQVALMCRMHTHPFAIGRCGPASSRQPIGNCGD